MKDKIGLYYYPFPENKRVRMYVREKNGEVEFRMRNEDDPGIWNDHGWVPYSAIEKASAIYDGDAIDPKQAYDIEIARALVKEDR